MVVRGRITAVLVAGVALAHSVAPTRSDAQALTEPLRVAGEVASVDATGTLTLRIGDPALPRQVRLWGVRITNEDAFFDFIVDRLIDCKVIYFIDGIAYGDCMASRNEFRVSLGRPDLRLTAWLPEFGWAVHSCTEIDRRGGVVMASGEGWLCSFDGVPLYFRPDNR